AETSDHGYPVLEHVKRLIEDEIIWAPAIRGGFVMTKRGGDFALHVGQDVSIGYSSHTDTAVRLYLQETFTFLHLTAEAAGVLAPSERAHTPAGPLRQAQAGDWLRAGVRRNPVRTTGMTFAR